MILYYSTNFRKILSDIANNKDNSINEDIANKLLELELKDITNINYSFFDIDIDNKKVFVINSNNIKNILNDDEKHLLLTVNDRRAMRYCYKTIYSKYSDTLTKSTIPLKIGKVINKLLTNLYTDKNIEDFSTLFLAKISILKSKFNNFQLVSGDDIGKYYSYKEYYDDNRGTLWNSCMREKQLKYFDFYNKNKNIFMLIHFHGNSSKIDGRALVWKIKSCECNNETLDFKYLMDRIYTINDYDINTFKEYAEFYNWAYKKENTYSSPKGIVYKKVYYKNANIYVDIEKESYAIYPYLDTFKMIIPSLKLMYNYSTKEDKDCYIPADGYTGTTTSGTLKEFVEALTENVFSKKENKEIKRKESKKILNPFYNDYVSKKYKTKSIENGAYSGSYYNDDENLVYSKTFDRYYHKNDVDANIVTFSEYENDYLPYNSVFYLVESFDKKLDITKYDVILNEHNENNVLLSDEEKTKLFDLSKNDDWKLVTYVTKSCYNAIKKVL